MISYDDVLAKATDRYKFLGGERGGIVSRQLKACLSAMVEAVNEELGWRDAEEAERRSGILARMNEKISNGEEGTDGRDSGA